MPGLDLDPTQRIVNVHWGGGAVFAALDEGAFGYYGNVIAPDKQKWKSIGEVSQGVRHAGGISYARINNAPVFVTGAHFKAPTPEDQRGAEILASRDGLTWTQVHFEPNIYHAPIDIVEFEFLGIVWDDSTSTEESPTGAFFASMLVVHFIYHAPPGGGDPIIDEVRSGERIFTSSDGFSWLQLSEKFDHIETEQGPFDLQQYCKKKQNKGDIPDGLQAYDEDKEIFMKPSDLDGMSYVFGANYANEPGLPGPQIKIEGGESPGIVSLPMAHCYAVAQANGIWAAVGSDENTTVIAVSTDDGKTWQRQFDGGEYKGYGIIAGPKAQPDEA